MDGTGLYGVQLSLAYDMQRKIAIYCEDWRRLDVVVIDSMHAQLNEIWYIIFHWLNLSVSSADTADSAFNSYNKSVWSSIDFHCVTNLRVLWFCIQRPGMVINHCWSVSTRHMGDGWMPSVTAEGDLRTKITNVACKVLQTTDLSLYTLLPICRSFEYLLY